MRLQRVYQTVYYQSIEHTYKRVIKWWYNASRLEHVKIKNELIVMKLRIGDRCVKKLKKKKYIMCDLIV